MSCRPLILAAALTVPLTGSAQQDNTRPADPFAGNEDRLRITDDAIERLEHEIEEANASLPELKSFVLPGGSERAARLFLARAVCRRAERAVLAVPDTNPLAAVYLNRLSDLLFVLARAANSEAGVAGPLWHPGSTP